jgi:hypothetical protein
MDRVPQPGDGSEREILLGWLGFHRDALRDRCSGLDADQLVRRAVPPSALSLLGIVRHMAEMERVYGGWPLGPKTELEFVWGEYTDDGPGVDFEVDVSMVDESMAAWDRERRTTDNALDQHPDLDELCHPGRRVRWTLQKLVGEYARHNGHADLIRESIDGRTGE